MGAEMSGDRVKGLARMYFEQREEIRRLRQRERELQDEAIHWEQSYLGACHELGYLRQVEAEEWRLSK